MNIIGLGELEILGEFIIGELVEQIKVLTGLCPKLLQKPPLTIGPTGCLAGINFLREALDWQLIAAHWGLV